ncbi:helix-turn-helix domain-containing protein [Kitasatospora sp. NPDC004289]
MTTQPTSAEVIARIRRHRLADGMSAQALADALTANGHPIARSTIAKQETGKATAITVDQVVATAQVFKIPPEALLSDMPCAICEGEPPAGFACNLCGAGTPNPH